MYAGSTVNAITIRAAVFCELSLFVNLWSGYFSLPLKSLEPTQLFIFLTLRCMELSLGNVPKRIKRRRGSDSDFFFCEKELIFMRNTLFPNLLFC